jgi:hypothetical protein
MASESCSLALQSNMCCSASLGGACSLATNASSPRMTSMNQGYCWCTSWFAVCNCCTTSFSCAGVLDVVLCVVCWMLCVVCCVKSAQRSSCAPTSPSCSPSAWLPHAWRPSSSSLLLRPHRFVSSISRASHNRGAVVGQSSSRVRTLALPLAPGLHRSGGHRSEAASPCTWARLRCD